MDLTKSLKKKSNAYPQTSSSKNYFKYFWESVIIITPFIAIPALIVACLAYVGQLNPFKAITPIDLPFEIGQESEWKITYLVGCTNKTEGNDYTEFKRNTLFAYNCAPADTCRVSICNPDRTCSNDLAPGSECSSDSYCGNSEKCNLDTCTCVSTLVNTYIPTFSSNTLFSMDSVIDTTPNLVNAYYTDLGNFIRIDISYNFNITLENSTNLGFDFTLPIDANETILGSGIYTLFSSDIPLDSDTNSEYNFVTSRVYILNSTFARASGVNQNNLWTESNASNSTLSGNLNFLYST